MYLCIYVCMFVCVCIAVSVQFSLIVIVGCIGYGMAKAAVNQLCQSLSGANSGLPPGSAAVAILP